MKLKDQIIESAYQLFSEKGYDKTSVSEIIKLAGTSKGGFYHHFTSKEEILEVITLSYVESVKLAYQELLEDDNLDVISNFQQSIAKVGQIKANSVKEWPKLKKMYDFEGNHVLLRKMGETFLEETSKYYYQLIVRGNKEGYFKANYPMQLASLWSREILELHKMIRKVLINEEITEEQLMDYLAFNQSLINTQLDTKEKIELIESGMKYLEEMKEAIKTI